MIVKILYLISANVLLFFLPILSINCIGLARTHTTETLTETIKEKWENKNEGEYSQHSYSINSRIRNVTVEKRESDWRYRFQVSETDYDLCYILKGEEVQAHTIDLKKSENLPIYEKSHELPIRKFKTIQNGKERISSNLIEIGFDLHDCQGKGWKEMFTLDWFEVSEHSYFPHEVLYATLRKIKNGYITGYLGKEFSSEGDISYVDLYFWYRSAFKIPENISLRSNLLIKKRYISDPKEIRKLNQNDFSSTDKQYENKKIDFLVGFTSHSGNYQGRKVRPKHGTKYRFFFRTNDLNSDSKEIPPFLFINRIDAYYYGPVLIHSQIAFLTALYPATIAVDLVSIPILTPLCTIYLALGGFMVRSDSCKW